MKEGLPERIEQLYSQRSRLSHVVGQRRHLYDAVGTGQVRLPEPDELSLDNIETIRRVGKVKQRVSSSIERISSKVSQLGQEIVGVEEELIFQASDYASRVNLVGSKTNEIKQYVEKGHLPRPLLEGLESQFKNLVSEPERNPDLQYGLNLLKQRQEKERQEKEQKPESTVVVISKEEARKEWPKIVVNFDTQEVTALGKVKKINDSILWGVLSRLAQSAGQNVSSKELKEIVNNARSSSLKKIGYVSDVIWLLRGRLKTAIPIPDYQPISCSDPFSQNAEYCLNARVEKIGVPQIPIAAPQVSEVLKDEVKVELPEIVINVEEQEITISGRVKKITDPFEWKIFYRLASTPGKNVSNQELKMLKEDNVLVNEKRKHRWMGDFIYNLRRTIKNLFGIPDYQPISRFGGKSKVEYRLNARVEGMPQPEEETTQERPKGKGRGARTKESTLEIFGKKISLAPLPRLAVEGIQSGSETLPVEIEDLASYVYEEEIKSGRLTSEQAVRKLRNIIKDARAKLLEMGIEIANKVSPLERFKGKKGAYFLREVKPTAQDRLDVDEEIITPDQEVATLPAATDLITDEELEQTTVPVYPTQPLPFEDEIVRIPYAPSKEELRSPIETRVLLDTLNTLHGHTRLWFDGLLESFYTVGRLHKNGGRITEDVKELGREISSVFETAFRKILRENASPILHGRWNDEDKRLWELLQETKEIWEIKDNNGFLRKVKQLIKVATDEYYERQKIKE